MTAVHFETHFDLNLRGWYKTNAGERIESLNCRNVEQEDNMTIRWTW